MDSGKDSAAAAPSTPDTAAETQGVARRVAIGSAIMIGGRIAMRGISIISTLILARLLLPEDFGLIGLAAGLIAIADVLTQANLGMAVVRRRVADRAIYDTAWTLNLLRNLLLAGVLAATAEAQAELLGDPRIAPVVLVVALTIALDGFGSIGLVRLQRELRYELIFRFELVTKLAAFLLTILFAVVLQNYWCLVLGNLVSRLVSLPYSYWVAPHRPRVSFAGAVELLHFSKWMVAANACGAIDAQTANLSIGRLVGLHSLGLWQMSYQIAAAPVTEVAVPIRGPVYAGYSRVLQDTALLRQHFLEGFALLCAVVMPLSVGIALVSPEVERLALGPAFAGAAALIALCALYALVEAIAHFTFNLFIVLDQQRRMIATHATMVLVRVPVVIAAAMLAGVEGVGVAMLATALLSGVVWHAQAGRLLGHGLSAVAAAAWRSLAAAVAMAAAVLALRLVLPAADGSIGGALLSLGILAPCGAIVHVATQLLLWRLAGRPQGAESRIIDAAGQLWRRFGLPQWPARRADAP
jgi:O-antigen/teichoic acid export membrane protein